MALPGRAGGENHVTALLKGLHGRPKFVYGVTERRKELFRVDTSHKRYRRHWPKYAKEEYAEKIQDFVRHPEAAQVEDLVKEMLAKAEAEQQGRPTTEQAAAMSIGWWRMVPKYTQYQCMRRAAIRIQAAIRCWIAQSRFVDLLCAEIMLATWWRERRTRIRWLQIRMAATTIARWWSVPEITPPEPDQLEDFSELDQVLEETEEEEDEEEEEEEESRPEVGQICKALAALDEGPIPLPLDPHFRELGEYYFAGVPIPVGISHGH